MDIDQRLFKHERTPGPASVMAARGMALAAILTAGLLVFAAGVHAAEPLDTKSIQDIAERLDQGLDGARLRIAIRPFAEDEVPVSAATEGLFNDALMAALQERFRRAGSGHSIVARAELNQVFREAEEFYDFNLAEALAAAKADVLVIGRITRAPKGGVFLSYRANRVATGQVMASTEPVFLAYDVEQDLDVNSARSLEQVINDAALHFIAQLGEIRQLRPKGLHYATSGVQTRFGEYARQLFLDAMSKKAGAQAWQPIAVEETTRGLKIEKGEVDAALVSEQASDYLFYGTYWDLGRYVELRLTLKNASGMRSAYKGLVLRKSIGDSLTIAPADDVLGLSDVAFPGPLGLYLSSDRGNNQVYRVGDEMHLLVQTSEDANLYCFYRSVDGSVVKLFPNSFVPDARLSGGFLHRIPGRTMPFRLRFSGPPGVESIRCYATDREIDRYLPDEVRRNDFETMAGSVVEDLNRIFRGIPEIRLSEATMVLTLD